MMGKSSLVFVSNIDNSKNRYNKTIKNGTGILYLIRSGHELACAIQVYYNLLKASLINSNPFSE